MEKSRKLPKNSKLSVIIPAYNSEKWIGPTLTHLWKSLSATQWKAVEILVIDDGSVDNTSIAARETNIGVEVKVVKQANLGRLKTRKNGIELASGDYVLMLDSRVYAKPGAFKYLVEQLEDNPEALVWNGHIIVERKGNPFARFWFAVTFLAWRRYLREPRLIHYGAKDFDYYPKGAGCFFAPRVFLEEAYSKFSTYYKDDRNANDDTSLIRHIASRNDIYLSPGFAFTYNSRSTLRAFTRHTLHRGIVFIDGYFRNGTRYFYPLIIYLTLLPVLVACVIVQPWLILLFLPVLLLIFLVAILMGSGVADAAALAYIMPVFALFYTAGLYKGILLKLLAR